MLASRHGGRVRCELGWTRDVLPALAGEIPPVGFLFHDAGHSRGDYVGDFRLALPLLAPGAVVLFDDIDWDDPRFAAVNPRCHRGWMDVVAHPSVVWAVEIGGGMGLALLRGQGGG
jgi:predicted O-methyltransferase YrrM